MTAYRYRALNPKGKIVKGVLEGDSERQVRAQLRGRQVLLLLDKMKSIPKTTMTGRTKECMM